MGLLDRLMPQTSMGRLLKDRYRSNRPEKRKRLGLWLKRAFKRSNELPDADEEYEFRASDGTIKFITPYEMQEETSPLPDDQVRTALHIERYMSDSTIPMFKIGFVYMLFPPDENQNVDRAVSETLQMYTEFFPDSRIDYKVAHLFEFEGVDSIMLMGTITRDEDHGTTHEFKHVYMSSESRFWNVNILYDARYHNAGAKALQVFNSIDFDIEMPFTPIDNIWEAEWNRFTMDDGIFSFEAPFPIMQLSNQSEVEGVRASATYGHETMYNFNIHSGYQSTEKEDITVEETLEQLKDLYVRDYKLTDTDFTEEVMPEFSVPNRMVSGTITEYRTRWIFRGLIFAVGNNVWFVQMRYHAKMEDGDALYQRVRESIRFDDSALEDVINEWLDKKS